MTTNGRLAMGTEKKLMMRNIKKKSPFAIHETNPIFADFELLRDDFLETVDGDVTINTQTKVSARQQREIQIYFLFLLLVFHFCIFFSLLLPLSNFFFHFSLCTVLRAHLNDI